MLQRTERFYDKTYGEEGLNAQRRWPNEEFCRFMGRRFFGKPDSERKLTKILEVGCGTGANLRLLAEEGFDAYGIELSHEAVDLVPHLLGKRNHCSVICGNMMELPWDGNYFHAIVDVFSSYCLDELEFTVFVEEIYRTLIKGGRYFSYTPSKGSEAFYNSSPSKRIDQSTLDGIRRVTAPYYGNFYPFRFMNIEDVESFFPKEKFEIHYIEKVSRTYGMCKERFEFIVFEAVKL